MFDSCGRFPLEVQPAWRESLVGISGNALHEVLENLPKDSLEFDKTYRRSFTMSMKAIQALRAGIPEKRRIVNFKHFPTLV
ncbi:hypothetical protein KGM_205209 [Danaus plexippus plexippus]|uniref:Uncharacterized protein n=1 Tax=Danaus plexippus plexippus TaxID=278856 RepID=A0A212F012_DANPL|nr:hypothetical protein KGM_205209 [Danaus plexippus plexippus]